MGLLQRIATWYLEKSGTIEAWFREFGLANKTLSGEHISQIRAMQQSTVMSCVAILSEDVAKLPGHVYRRRTDGGKEIVKRHPLNRILRKPNDLQTWFEFCEMIIACLLLRGNAYAAIIRNGRGEPLAMIPVNPDWVTLLEAPDGTLFYNIARNTQYLRAALSTLPDRVAQEDVFHLRWLSLSGTAGLSRIGLVRETIALGLVQEKHAAALFGNYARPGGVLETDKKIGKIAHARLKEQAQSGFSNENVGKIMVLEEGLKWKQLTMTSVDAEFLESRRFTKEEIAAIFRVPPHKLGIPAAGTGTNHVQADQDYVNNVVTSLVERLEAKLDDVFGLDSEELFTEFDVDRFLRADIMTRLTAKRVAVLGMIMKPNEARRSEGLGDADGGDKLYQPTNMAPIGFEPAGASSGPGSDQTGAPGAGGDGDMPAAEGPKA